jgi:hypothetical protein
MRKIFVTKNGTMVILNTRIPAWIDYEIGRISIISGRNKNSLVIEALLMWVNEFKRDEKTAKAAAEAREKTKLESKNG